MRTLVTAAAVRSSSGIVADAVLVEGGVVAAVGDAAGLRPFADVEAPFPGGIIVPGLADSHIHPTAWAARRTGLDLAAVGDFPGLLDALAAHARHLPAGTPVVGFGLDEETLVEGRLPDRTLLDRVGRPVLVTRVCGHVAVASTAVLDLAGLGSRSPDPPGGSLGREPGGALDGVVREAAVGMVTAAVEDLLPDPDPDTLLGALDDLVGMGVTRIDAVASTGNPLWCGSGSELELLFEVAPRLPLDVRVLVVASDPAELLAAAERLRRAGGRISYLGWKGFADGSLGARTAALTRPYADAPGERGILRLDPDDVLPLLAAVEATDGVAAVHAIGDAAVAATLDLFAAAERLGVLSAGRTRIEHASLLSPSLIRRMADSGVVASVQPGFITADAPWVERRLGPERLPSAYPLASLLAAGVTVVGGSDAPVTEPNPWDAMAAARNRSGPERLTATGALGLYAGELAPGRPADLVVVDPGGGAVTAVWKDGEAVRPA